MFTEACVLMAQAELVTDNGERTRMKKNGELDVLEAWLDFNRKGEEEGGGGARFYDEVLAPGVEKFAELVGPKPGSLLETAGATEEADGLTNEDEERWAFMRQVATQIATAKELKIALLHAVRCG